MESKINLQLLKNFGLSLNTKKKYFVIFEPCTWSICHICDNIEDAIENSSSTIEEYYEDCKNASCDEHGIKYDENYVGHNWHFQKGFVQNLSVWQLLDLLCDEIKYDVTHKGIEYSRYYVLVGIDSSLHAYPDFVKNSMSKKHPNNLPIF